MRSSYYTFSSPSITNYRLWRYRIFRNCQAANLAYGR